MGAIVFGTDQGLCGQFNNIVTAHALGEMNALGIAKENRIVISVGLRAADILEDSGQKVLEILSTPGSTAGITPMVQDITTVLEDWRFKRQIDTMVPLLQRVHFRGDLPPEDPQAPSRRQGVAQEP